MVEMTAAILVTLAVAGALALAMWMLTAGFPTVTRVVRRSFWCPVHGRNVTVEFQEAVWHGRLVEVTRCSAFSASQAVTCEKVCLRLRTPPSVHADR